MMYTYNNYIYNNYYNMEDEQLNILSVIAFFFQFTLALLLLIERESDWN